MVHKIAIGLAAMAIAMGGATSGVLAQGGGGEANKPVGAGHAEANKPGHAEGNKPGHAEANKPIGGHAEANKPAVEGNKPIVEANKPHKPNQTTRVLEEKRPATREGGGGGGVHVHLGGMRGGHEMTRRETVRPETTREARREERGGGRVHIHLGSKHGGHPGTFAFRHAVPFHPGFHGGTVVHHYRTYGAMRGGQRGRIKTGAYGQKIKIGGGAKRGGVTLRVR